MRKWIFGVLLFFPFASGIAQQEVETVKKDGPVISIENDTYDYGTIDQGANGDCEFVIINTGNEALIISSCRGSCGCTVPKCPEQAIAPGESATIKVHYNTNKIGTINKKVMITSNAINSNAQSGTVYELYIRGYVKEKPQGGAPVNNSGVPAN